MPKSLTVSSTPKLSELARHVVIPEGIVTTAWPRVVAQCAAMGVEFDAWQHGIGAIALGKRGDGKYAATVGGVVLSIPRQVGKTFLVGMIVIALCILVPGLTVIWSAHRTRTATKTFGSLKGMTSKKKVAPFMLDPRNTNGEQEIRFVNGSVIMFGAREQGFGRGFDEVDIEVFDEAQILSEKALEDMVPAANQSRQPTGALLFFMGTPPRPSDPGEEFTNRRLSAIDGRSKNIVYVEFSADENAKPDDHKAWAKANPSYPLRTPLESMQRMRANLTDDDSFRREALGIWDPANESSGAFPSAVWYRQSVQDVGRLGLPVAAVDVSVGLKQSAALVICGESDGRDVVHVARHEPDSSQEFIARVAEILKPKGIRDVALDLYGENQNLIPLLEAAGFTVHRLNQADMRNACTGFSEAVINRLVWHRNQAPLNAAVAGSGARKSDAGVVFSQLRSSSDQTPLRAAAVAWAIYKSGVAAQYDVMESAY